MATNIAMKRFKKAQRRKEILAGRRQQETIETSLAGRVRRAAELPIQYCLLSNSVFEVGMAPLILARGATRYNMTLASFLIDTFGRGVKDVMVRSIDASELEMYMETMGVAAPLVAVEPSYGRKLLRDVTAWARSNGFASHRDFVVAERLFGDVDAAACNVDFRFGYDSYPAPVAGFEAAARTAEPSPTPELKR